MTTCPACAAAELVPCADLGELPATCGVTWAEPPVDPPLGRLTLWACPACAHVLNTSFDPAVRATTGQFDNSMLSSASYRAHVVSVALRLGQPATTLELGCNEGELLRLLPGRRDGWGHVPHPVHIGDPDGGMTLRPAPWSPGEERYDLVVARHVLEHVPDPFALLVQLRAASATGKGYFEVPDAGYDLGQAGWDVIYPHASYFHAGSLAAMCERAGFRVLRAGLAFHGQYLYVETGDQGAVEELLAGDQQATVAGFGARFGGLVEHWRAVTKEHTRPALWGAGARGITFLATVDPGRELTVVDLNPGKHGRYLPTGHRVDSPAHLPKDTDLVVITNPAYRDEVRADVAALGLAAEVLVA